MDHSSAPSESVKAGLEHAPVEAETQPSLPAGTSESLESLRAEVACLQRELNESREKFHSWEERAKQGVNQLRQRIVTLTASLRQAQSERDALQTRLTAQTESAQSQSATSPCNSGPDNVAAPSDAGVTLSPSNAGATGVEVAGALSQSQGNITTTTISPDTSHTIDLFVTFVLSCTADVLEARAAYAMGKMDTLWSTAAHYAIDAQSLSNELDSYKRRTATTLRMQTKNNEALQKHVTELDTALKATKEEVTMREHALLGRDDAIASLEKQLEELSSAKQQLKSQLESGMNAPNMQQINVLQGEMESRLEQMHAEYARLESTLRAQHHAELNQQRAVHEEEMELLRQEMKDMVRSTPAMQSRLPLRDTVPHEDIAYDELFRDYRELERAHNALTRENAELKRRCQHRLNSVGGSASNLDGGGEVDGAPSTRNAPASSSRSDSLRTFTADTVHGGATNGLLSNVADGGQDIFAGEFSTLQEAKVVVMKLQGRLKFSADELWKAKREIFELQKACSKERLPSGALGAQQVSYMRSVIVQLLCSSNKPDVVKHLIPVLIKVLHLDDHAVEQIYGANPYWRL